MRSSGTARMALSAWCKDPSNRLSSDLASFSSCVSGGSGSSIPGFRSSPSISLTCRSSVEAVLVSPSSRRVGVGPAGSSTARTLSASRLSVAFAL